ncbi:glutathione S-transferase N-terminal domain-containing protein [uncultured Umboniibacter sp.]|uniref:glutaredoxin family protein n=1 Tax=uncultured Umboniibacter sp. TaxID=1798917 RepID=UPI0026149DBD|nr:glutathione S-transferase N-terminal domain-containing protein [uncultured Umboniibacter sp.]
MAAVRFILGRIILIIDFLTRPKKPVLSNEELTKYAAITAPLALYEFPTCPFCVKVKRHFRRRGLDIELRNAKKDIVYRKQLAEDGGKLKAPCLRIKAADGSHTWLYESDDIIAYVDSLINIEPTAEAL